MTNQAWCMGDAALPSDLTARVTSFFQSTRAQANERLSTLEPLQLVLLSLLVAYLQKLIFQLLRASYHELQDHGLDGASAKVFFSLIRYIPGVKAYIQNEQDKVVAKLQASAASKRKRWQTELPRVGWGHEVLDRLKEIKAEDKLWQGKCSGTVYMGGEHYDEHLGVVNAAYSMFAHTNPLHPDVFPSITQFEAEIVAMTAALLGGKSPAAGGEVCGNVTSGGSESILMAVKATRDYMRRTRDIVRPEMVLPESAHSAYDKAAQYFGIRILRVPVGKDFRADVVAIRRAISRNTIMIVGSAPGFPHGVIDPIKELGQLAKRHGICFHVDCCLGGFVLPFARELGWDIPPFDFQVPGVTSISADVHKYGLGPKGTSVILYRDHRLRRHQFVAVTEWSGGLYVSPSAAGSRPGGLIAAAWGAMNSIGKEGYLDATRKIMEASQRIVKGIRQIEGLYVLGEPDMTVIAFAATDLDIYKVNDALAARGWSLNALQRPASIHICVTLQHVATVDQFLEDLEAAANTVRKDPSKFEDGMAPIYGAAAKMPDRGTVRDLLVAYMDSTC